MSYCQATFFKQSLLQHDSIMLFPPSPCTKASPRSRSTPIFFTRRERDEQSTRSHPSLSIFGCLPWLPVAHAHRHTQRFRIDISTAFITVPARAGPTRVFPFWDPQARILSHVWYGNTGAYG
ncbi:hypothetical protein BDV37DRAFT_237446 [Aspergillus pseudonomiae]|uniref:Uncharacterized protein n=1 Tax=Aspergillus pseudonomiae TaxID=1506151 RepID=A0A5N7DSF7_9EURO|nr:uncharacterized protein BDV37DRAFT_237446 [Aspergillus pseudonomiae]KAE8409407.1 hypothetical protein BDV37DRAFT_237446 [Aspergillus pseudonomiae]